MFAWLRTKQQGFCAVAAVSGRHCSGWFANSFSFALQRKARDEKTAKSFYQGWFSQLPMQCHVTSGKAMAQNMLTLVSTPDFARLYPTTAICNSSCRSCSCSVTKMSTVLWFKPMFRCYSVLWCYTML